MKDDHSSRSLGNNGEEIEQRVVDAEMKNDDVAFQEMRMVCDIGNTLTGRERYFAVIALECEEANVLVSRSLQEAEFIQNRVGDRVVARADAIDVRYFHCGARPTSRAVL